jgi:GcrA cell cycle regulator
MSIPWPETHDAALKNYFGSGMSFRQIAAAVNAEMGTNYSRNAVLGRASRLGLRSTVPKGRGPSMRAKRPKPEKAQVIRFKPAAKAPTVAEREEIKLRCAEVVPLNVPLTQLQPGQCRWPYGDDFPFTFCAHPATEGSSYCMPHFCLALGTGTEAERAADRMSGRTT